MLIGRILAAALFAGVATGIAVTLVQLAWSLPLIELAEAYEATAEVGGHNTGGHGHDAAAWAPADGLERLFWTTLFNILYATGVALLLASAFALRQRISWQTGLGWGGLGFLAFTVAPTIGLEPTLPGGATADLAARQSWWIFTALVTASGLALLVASRRTGAIAVAVALILAPHLIDAPTPSTSDPLVPAELSHQFMLSVLFSSAVFWLMVGSLSGLMASRLELSREPRASWHVV